MKNKLNKFLAVWVCVVMIATGFFAVLQTNTLNVKAESSSGETSSSEQQRSTTYVPHDPIYIDGNTGFTSANGVSNPVAEGTEADPYIIEDWDINASSAHGIEIRNTDAYFIIRNCYVHDGRYNYNYNDGIYFYNVTNGQVENTNSFNNHYGIHLYGRELPHSTCSGYHAWYSNKDNDLDTTLTRDFDLTCVTSATLTFWHWYKIEGYYDGGNVAIYDTSTGVWDVIQPIGGYPSNNIFSLDNEPGFSGNSGGWKKAHFDLTPFVGSIITLRLRYGTDYYVIHSGWIVDDIKIEEIGFFDDVESGTEGWASYGWYIQELMLSPEVNIITNSTAYNNDCGIHLDFLCNSIISNNNALNNDWGIYLRCSNNNNIYNNRANSNNDDGIFLDYSSNNNIFNNNASNNKYGIGLDISSYNNIFNNSADSNTVFGIRLYFSSYNNIFNNNASNKYYGIYLYHSSNNTIHKNNASNNKYGIHLWFSSFNNVYNNIVNSNNGGIDLSNSPHNSIYNNNVSNNGAGIYLGYAVGYYSYLHSNNNRIYNNNILNNHYGLHLCHGIYNKIYNNNFIDNKYQAGDSRVNQWDDGYPSGGNYWSDYTGVDANDDGIGDTPYYIPGGENKDNYPLMNPIGKPPVVEPGIPDLAVSDKDISWNADYLIEGETVELRATIHNIGTASATATVKFYVDEVGLEPNGLVGQDTVSIPPNEIVSASIQWDVDSTSNWCFSKKAIFVKIVDSTPSESNLGNNKASKNISINNWGWGRIEADKTLTKGVVGKGIVVAVIDRGISYTNPDLKDNMWINEKEDINHNGEFDNWPSNEQQNGVFGDIDNKDNDGNGYLDDVIGWDFDGYIPFFHLGDNDPSPDPREEGSHHATHVAGILGARRYDNYGITGVAPEAKIMNLRINLSNFFIQPRLEAAQAIRYAADNGADIISMSFGSPITIGLFDDIQLAVDYAYNKGCVIVAAAGNSNIPRVFMPASCYNVLAVAATDRDNQRWDEGLLKGSNYGYEIDISAPGVDIWSDYFPGGAMFNDTGTSMATPFVSGVAALVLDANENLTRHPDVVYALLKDTATPLSDKEPDWIFDSWEYGAGLVNAAEAVKHSNDEWVYASLDCPANLSVYDSEGRHVGLNDTGSIDLQIPRAYYSEPEAEPETLVIFNSTGDLTIDVIGNSSGIYNLTMESYDGETIKTFEIWDSELTNKTIDSIILKEGRNTVIIKTNEDEKTYSLNITKKTLNETDTFTIKNITIEDDESHSYDVLDWGNLTTANNTVILNITETGPGAINSTIYLNNGMNGTVVEHNIKEFKIKYMMNETVDLMETLDEMDIDQEAKEDLNNTLTGVLLHLATALYYHTNPDLPDNVSVPQKNDTCDRHLILARFMLCEFIKQVEGYREQDRISNEDANILMGDADTIIDQITRILEDGGPGPKPVDDDSPPMASLLNLNMFFVNNIFILLIIALIGILMTAYPYYREIKIDGDFEMYRKLGELSFRYGSNKTAIEHFKKAIWLNPNDAIIWNDMGVVLKNKGKYRSALKCYDKAIKLNPNYERAWYNKGCALSRISDYYRAFDCFNKVVELNAENLDAGNMRDEVLERIINVMNN